MIQNGQTYLNKSATFAANLFKQVHQFCTIGHYRVDGTFHKIERELVKSFIKKGF